MKDAKIKSEVEQSEDVYVDAQLVRCTFAQMYYQLLTRIAFWFLSSTGGQSVVILSQDPDTGVLTQEIVQAVPEDGTTDGSVEEQGLTEVVPEPVELTEEQLISSHVV